MAKKATTAKQAKPSGLTIQGCTVTHSPWQMSEHVAAAVRATAEAAAANARAIEALAQRITGPVDNSVGIMIKGHES